MLIDFDAAIETKNVILAVTATIIVMILSLIGIVWVMSICINHMESDKREIQEMRKEFEDQLSNIRINIQRMEAETKAKESFQPKSF